MLRYTVPTALLALAAACAPTPPAPETSGPVLSYTDAFVMEPIGGRDLTMGGVSISVEGGDVTLKAANSPSFGAIELHTMAMNDGKMQMRQVEGFEIADGGSLQLERGGDHMMMFDVGSDVIAGDTVDITLNFTTDGAPLTLVIEADVRAVGE
ncbi:MAG: copper chaperone PCu(A)C [Pseudomonadota bacterium]